MQKYMIQAIGHVVVAASTDRCVDALRQLTKAIAIGTRPLGSNTMLIQTCHVALEGLLTLVYHLTVTISL